MVYDLEGFAGGGKDSWLDAHASVAPTASTPNATRIRFMAPSFFPALRSGAALAAPQVEPDRHDDDRADDDELDVRRHVDEVEAVAEHGDDDHAEEGPNQATVAAAEPGAADHDRRDRVELQRLPHRR